MNERERLVEEMADTIATEAEAHTGDCYQFVARAALTVAEAALARREAEIRREEREACATVAE
jgi:hypothetical protein